MKRIILLVTATLFIMNASVFASENAFDKGAVRIGGHISFIKLYSGKTYRGTTYADNSKLIISHSISFAIKKGLFIGLNSDYDNSLQNKDWTIGPKIEFYASTTNSNGELIKTIIPYFRFMAFKGKYYDGNYNKFGINTGILKMFLGHFGIDIGISYSYKLLHSDYYYIDDKVTHQIMLGVGLDSFLF